MHARDDTSALPPFLTTQSDGVTIAVKVTPRASKDEIGEALGAELRIKVTAPPVDAAANEALIRLLAETLGCSRSSIQIIRGQTSRHKLIKVFGLTAKSILTKLNTR